MKTIQPSLNLTPLPTSQPGVSRRLPISITVLGDEDSLREFKDVILVKYPNAQVTPSVMADATNPAKKKILISIPLDKNVRKLEDLLTLGK